MESIYPLCQTPSRTDHDHHDPHRRSSSRLSSLMHLTWRIATSRNCTRNCAWVIGSTLENILIILCYYAGHVGITCILSCLEYRYLQMNSNSKHTCLLRAHFFVLQMAWDIPFWPLAPHTKRWVFDAQHATMLCHIVPLHVPELRLIATTSMAAHHSLSWWSIGCHFAHGKIKMLPRSNIHLLANDTSKYHPPYARRRFLPRGALHAGF